MVSSAEQVAEAALNAALLGTWGLDVVSRTLTASAHCKAQYGLTADAPLQIESLAASIPHETHRQRFVDALERAMAEHGPLQVDVPIRWPDGSDHWLRTRGRVIDATRLVVVTQDVTAERQAEDELRDADHRKDEILTLVAHELRGPLSAILSAVYVLDIKGPRVPVLQEARAVIRRQTAHLAKLVEDLLDIGRLATGKFHLERGRVELTSLLHQAAETCRPLIERRCHALSVESPLTSVYLDVDPGRIVQVLCNLLSNAAKYMPDGGQIILAAASDDATATISVRDQGIGIPANMLERVFDRFVQVRSAQYRSSGGLGIGLSLAKAAVELHGGTLEARSEGLGKGAEFIVRLPMASSRRRAESRGERHGLER
jgi:signal transduction histidine kinase